MKSSLVFYLLLLEVLVVVVVVANATSTSANTNSGDSNSVLERLVVVHRHGARTPLLFNPDMCGPLGCGQLSPEGRLMLESLGSTLRKEYGSFLFPPSSSSWDSNGNVNDSIPSPFIYDPNVFGVRSSGESRTVQSAEAMLSGLFGLESKSSGSSSSSSLFFAAFTRPQDDDMLLRPQTTPGQILWNQASNESIFTYLTDVVMPSVSINYTTTEGMLAMKAIGEELNLGGECIAPSLRGEDDGALAPYTPFLCLLDAQDYSWFLATTFNKTELAMKYPAVAANFDALDAAMKTYNEWWYYKWGDKFGDGNYTFNAGGIGHDLANAILADAKKIGTAVPSVSSTTTTMRLVTYSTHDTTLMPLAMAFGNMTLMRPDFAAAFVFEVRRSVDTGAMFVVARYGSCDQTPGSNHTYVIQPFMMQCISNSSSPGTAVVQTTSSSCPVDDVVRYLDTKQKAASPMGFYCFLSDKMRAEAKCAPSDVLSAEVAFAPGGCDTLTGSEKSDCLLQQMCAMYRQRCPQWACTSSVSGDNDGVPSSSTTLGAVGALDSSWNCQPLADGDTPTPQQAALIASLREQINGFKDSTSHYKVVLASLMGSALGGGLVIFILALAMSRARAAFLKENDLPHQKPLIVQ